jgi:hypothetical protein
MLGGTILFTSVPVVWVGCLLARRTHARSYKKLSTVHEERGWMVDADSPTSSRQIHRARDSQGNHQGNQPQTTLTVDSGVSSVLGAAVADGVPCRDETPTTGVRPPSPSPNR